MSAPRSATMDRQVTPAAGPLLLAGAGGRAPRWRRGWRRRRGVLPGFGLTLGYTTFHLGALVVLPLGALALRAASVRPGDALAVLGGPRVLAAFGLSVGTAAAAALVNLVFGTLVAWALVRYRFAGRSLVDALVDLPLCLPTAVAGIALTALWADDGWIGRHLAARGLHAAYHRGGVLVALVFVGLPFVVRTVEPVLRHLDPATEEAAAVLGAGRLEAVRRVVLPALWRSMLGGFTLAFARGLGEYGSVVFIAGNLPGRTEIVPLLIVTRLEQYDLEGATVLALALLVVSAALLGAMNLASRRLQPPQRGS